MQKKIQTAVYYFPNYHQDFRNVSVHGQGWNEWELVRKATPRFNGHKQPKVPLWGYEDESDPAVMAKKIDAAANHEIDCFIFDWYYYNDGPFLERALEEGFMLAPNNDRIKFALMWANHNWVDIHPVLRTTVANPKLLYPGKVNPEVFEQVCDYVIEHYFKHPSYWKIDGCPYFSIYELFKLIEGFDRSIEKTAEAVKIFRNKVKAAGFPDLHFNAVVWGVQILPGETSISNPEELIDKIGFDSVTSYVWIHHYDLPDYPVTQYESAMQFNADYWGEAAAKYSVPYYPNVTMGWDTSPRTCQSDAFDKLGYPFMPVLDTSPREFQTGIKKAFEFVNRDKSDRDRFITINAWNEWTEGSYLEPDTVNGFSYLKSVKEISHLYNSI